MKLPLPFAWHSDALTGFLGGFATKGALIAAAALLVGWLLRRLSPARRHTVWLGAASALALLGVVQAMMPSWRVLPVRQEGAISPPIPSAEAGAWISEPRSTSEPALPSRKKDAAPAPLAAPLEAAPAGELAPAPISIAWTDALPWLPVLWATLALILGARVLAAAVRLRSLERRCLPLPDGPALGMVVRVAREIGLPRKPCVLLGEPGSVPMVWGVLRARLLLPEDALEWPEEKLRAVLLHEMAHLRRGDPLALLLAQFALVAHGFNPLAWEIVRRLRADQERSCDDAVLHHGVRASDYAQHLLEVARCCRRVRGIGPCALAMARLAPVESRIASLLDGRARRQPAGRLALPAATALGVLLALPLGMLAREQGAGLRGRILDRHGVVLAETTPDVMRRYPLKALAGHVIGFTGRKPPSEPAVPEGRTGLEKAYDEALQKGEDVTLTLDARVQSLATRAMAESGVKRGACVVLDPATGDVLAAVSLPSCDFNVFIPAIDEEHFRTLAADKNYPLLERCFGGQFAPGSTYKPFSALAGIAAGVGGNTYTCEGGVRYGSVTMKCWISSRQEGGHGALSLSQAITKSCNCYFYQLANEAGWECFEKIGGLLGFGEAYGLLPEEKTGNLPTATWLAEKRPNERLSAGHLANLAIGQGFVLATPVQLAVLAATIGNGGKVPQPGLVQLKQARGWRADLIAEGVSKEHLGHLREGMRLVVHDENGTGQKARSEKAVIAGKTGTAQRWRNVNGKTEEDNVAWFIGFAPFDKPSLAFAIVKEGGKSGGGDCAPIAKRIVEESLALPADGSGSVEPVEAGVPGAASQSKASAKVGSSGQEKSLLHPNDQALRAFFDGPLPNPHRFHVMLKRIHYFGDAVPDAATKDCFEILTIDSELRPIGRWHVFLPRSTELARSVAEVVTWSTRTTAVILDLQWRESDGRRWVEMVGFHGLADDAARESPSRPEPAPGREAAQAGAKQSQSASDPVSALLMDKELRQRWEFLKKECDLGDLPAGSKDLHASLTGNTPP